MNDIYQGDCIEVRTILADNSVDTIITDPPYGLEFMGKGWDKGVPGAEYWKEFLAVTKPGGMLLAFGGTRTYHRMVCAIEDAGWEIRDCMMWLYGSGFPKSHNLHGQFEGWGTALKPAWEPIIVAMKPLDGTFAQNAEKHGVAGINVDGGKINGAPRDPGYVSPASERSPKSRGQTMGKMQAADPVPTPTGRWPANLLLDEDAAAMLDEQSGITRSASGPRVKRAGDSTKRKHGGLGIEGGRPVGFETQNFGDSGGASRFFYCAKASKSERNAGCEDLGQSHRATIGRVRDRVENGVVTNARSETVPNANTHPTVKPLKLMEYLCTLTKTPTGGIVLDPFAGSGTTLLAAKNTGRQFVGIEKDEAYVAIIEARLGVKEAA